MRCALEEQMHGNERNLNAPPMADLDKPHGLPETGFILHSQIIRYAFSRICRAWNWRSAWASKWLSGDHLHHSWESSEAEGKKQINRHLLESWSDFFWMKRTEWLLKFGLSSIYDRCLWELFKSIRKKKERKKKSISEQIEPNDCPSSTWVPPMGMHMRTWAIVDFHRERADSRPCSMFMGRAIAKG